MVNFKVGDKVILVKAREGNSFVSPVNHPNLSLRKLFTEKTIMTITRISQGNFDFPIATKECVHSFCEGELELATIHWKDKIED